MTLAVLENGFKLTFCLLVNFNLNEHLFDVFPVAVVSSSPAKRQDFSNEYYDTAESNNYDNVEDVESLATDQEAAHSLIGGTQQQKAGFSQGSGLRSIAQGSADQANNAVLNQHAAANQAAYVAKNTLAQAANQV